MLFPLLIFMTYFLKVIEILTCSIFNKNFLLDLSRNVLDDNQDLSLKSCFILITRYFFNVSNKSSVIIFIRY